MHNHPLLATRLYNCALLITPGKAEVIEQVFRAHQEGRAALLSPATPPVPRQEFAAPGTVRADGGYLRTQQGVAIISMLGTLVQRAGGMEAMSGLTGYNQLASQLQAALDDPRVDAILLEIDSPGGEANGAFDLQTKIRAAAQKKPTWAIANEQAFSAAYLQASGAGKLFVPAPGMVGSIGVVMLHVDQSQKDARSGMVYTPIFAGDHKVDFSSHAPLSEDAMALAQAEVDRVCEMFVSAVADGRGIDPQTVRDTQAGLIDPKTALDLGMIDGIQGFDETLAQLAAEAQHVRIHGMRGTRAQQGADWQEVLEQAASEQRARAALGLTHSLTGETTMITEAEKAAQATLIAEARAAGLAEGKTAATTEAAATAKAATETERKRVHAIQTCEAAKTRPALAAHLALETDMTVEQAQALLAKAAAETPDKPTNLLASAMAKVPNPKIGADGKPTDDDEPKKATVIGANDLFAARRKQAGHAA